MRSWWLILALGALPAVARALPVGGSSRLVAGGPADQADAVLDAGQLAFTSGAQVMLGDLATGALRVAADGASEPELARNVLVYRTPAGIALQFTLTGALLRAPAEPGAAAPVVSPAAAAWEVGAAGERDIGWYQPVSGLGGVLAQPGDQRAPAIAGSTIAFLDDAAGGALLAHDLTRKETRQIAAGGIRSVAVDGAGATLRFAIARPSATGDLDVELLDAAGAPLAALVQPGEQRNPRLSGAWIAFEDLSAGRPVVVLWNWTLDLAYVPRPSQAAQSLGDVAEATTGLTLVLSESNGTDLDLHAYTLPLPLVDDGTGGDWPPKVVPARCDDPEAVELASLVVARDRPEPQTGEVSFTTGDLADLGVLLCADEEGWADASIALDGTVVATPADFAHPRAHVERRRVVKGGAGLVTATLSGAGGSELRVRVLVDPAGTPRVVAPGPVVPPGGGGPVTPPVKPPSSEVEADAPAAELPGCGAGAAGPLAWLGLAAWFARRRGVHRR